MTTFTTTKISCKIFHSKNVISDTMSDSIHLSKCRPVICNSEDDTIMEEYSQHQKENYAPKQHPQKIATILRSRSCRDREVLSEYWQCCSALLSICFESIHFESSFK